jgi:hypothetical protein
MNIKSSRQVKAYRGSISRLCLSSPFVLTRKQAMFETPKFDKICNCMELTKKEITIGNNLKTSKK